MSEKEAPMKAEGQKEAKETKEAPVAVVDAKPVETETAQVSLGSLILRLLSFFVEASSRLGMAETILCWSIAGPGRCIR
jgi:hypothetical protein